MRDRRNRAVLRYPRPKVASGPFSSNYRHLMLPPELLSIVCSYLEPRDLIALAETSRSFRVALSDVRKMLLKCPYHSLEHSDWSSWQAVADNWDPEAEIVTFANIDIDEHYNEPLPNDFFALQGDMQRKSRYFWNYCDRGIYDQTSEEYVDLKTDEDKGDVTYLSRAEARTFFFGNVKSDDHYIHYQHTTDTATVLARSEKGVVLQIKYRDDKDYQEYLISSSSSFRNCYELQLIGNVAFVYKFDYEAEEDYEATFCVARGSGFLRVDDGAGISCPPYGWLHYNGCLYKGIYEEEKGLQIVSGHYEDNSKRAGGGFDICHDDRYPRYGVAYSMGGLFPMFLVDLKAQQLSPICLDAGYLPVIGVSEGKMGVWKFSYDYLEKKCHEQQKSGVLELIEEVFEELEQCVEAINDYGNGDFDPAWF
ncbi:hypothetical protein CKK34_5188 [Yarrowia sp. E02]|nr:hypothetical protein CKK34_5188 [Yarrowia sp. E02]